MYQDFIIRFPGIKGRGWSFRNEPVTLNGTRHLIVPGDDQFTSEIIIAEPHFVFGKEPVRVMSNVQLSEGLAWKGGCQTDPRNVVLDVLLP